MLRKLCVANLSRTADGRNLEVLFAPHGTVRSAEVITDPTAWSRNTGVGWVEMSSDEESTAAITALNGTLYCGSTLEVGWDEPQNHTVPAGGMGVRGGPDNSGTAVAIESDAEAAKRLAAKIETHVMLAGSSDLKPETASSGAALHAGTPLHPSVPSVPDVNPMIQAAAEVVIAANVAADAAASLASRAADAATAASNAAAQAGSRPAGEAMSTAYRVADQNAYAANKAADAAANVADMAGEQVRKAEIAASLLQQCMNN
jgi:cold-inducible RNA-binding protein